jgi:hypothetical protein
LQQHRIFRPKSTDIDVGFVSRKFIEGCARSLPPKVFLKNFAVGFLAASTIGASRLHLGRDNETCLSKHEIRQEIVVAVFPMGGSKGVPSVVVKDKAIVGSVEIYSIINYVITK